MSTPDPSASQGVNLDIRCNLDADAIIGFTVLLQELLEPAAIPHLEDLRSIMIVPEGQLPETVNAILRETGAPDSVYQPGEYAATGIAFPVERDGEVACQIVLDEKLMHGLSPEDYHPTETVSTLLEELLHVAVYSTLWTAEQSPTTTPATAPVSSLSAPRDDLWGLCFRAFNEYIANRRKSYLFASLRLYAMEGGYSTGLALYPNPLGPILDRAKSRLVSIITGAASKRLSISDGWTQLGNCLYRDVVEPLSRESAHREGCEDAQRDGSISADEPLAEMAPTAASSQFYAAHVAPYWQLLHGELAHCYDTFDTQPSETLAALDTMRSVMEELLAHLGVTVRPTDDGGRYAYFNGFRAISLSG